MIYLDSLQIIKEISSKIVETYKTNLYAILHIGSSIHIENKPNDIDLVIILKERDISRYNRFTKNNQGV